MSSPTHLALSEGAPGSAGDRSPSPSGGVHLLPERIDQREDLPSHSRTISGDGEVHRAAVAGPGKREHHPMLTIDITAIDAATPQMVEGAGDGRPRLARTVITPAMPPTPEDSPSHDYSPPSQAAIK